MTVHRSANPFGGAAVGTALGPLRITVSPAANERYWSSAGIDHPELREGIERYEKREREYAVVEAVVALPDGSPLWTSIATFCEQ